MPALAALVLLASSTTTSHVEDLFPGTMVCSCTKTPSSVAPVVSEDQEAYKRSQTTWAIASGATSVVLLAGSVAAHLHSTGLTSGLPDSSRWGTASTAMLVGGSVLAGFSAAFLVVRF